VLLSPDPSQDGIATRAQLLRSGVTPGQIRARLTDSRWQVVHPGVYATFSGPIPARALAWAAILRAGEGAAAGPRTSLWLCGATDEPPRPPDVVLPAERRLRARVPFTVERRRGLSDDLHPVARPPRLRIEAAVLARCGQLDRPEAVADLVIRVVQRRLTTAQRLRTCIASRSRQRWRALLTEILAEVDQGVRSMLELRWLRDVERAHRLPPSSLNRADSGASGREYRDAEFVEFGLVAELDGRESHPTVESFRDRRRDNRVTVSGRRTLRYGWHEIAQDPCGVAAEVAAVLQTLGWTETVRACGPRCGLHSDRGRSLSWDDTDRPRSLRPRS
jgi:hypothetical protein